MVFEEVQADLESEGYKVQPFILPAAGVNAPHRRDRVWFVAYRNGKRCDNRGDNRQERYVPNNINGNASKGESERNRWECRSCEVRDNGNAPNANGTMRERRQSRNKTQERPQSINQQFRGYNELHRTDWQEFPTQPPLCSGDDGLPSELDGITFSKWRNESIKAAGNAIVPQVALQIFKAIEQYEHTISVTPTKR